MRVLLADNNALMLEGIRGALQSADGIEIVGEARSSSDVIPLLRRTEPDVVLIDVQMPGAFACLDALGAEQSSAFALVLSDVDDPERAWAAFRRGASAYLLKSIAPSDLPVALRLACERALYAVPPAGAREEALTGSGTGLTARELSVLKAVAAGLSNQAIAKELWVTEQTVKFHLTNVYRKLGVGNRTQAARFAHEHDLV
jgi:DNA-binding NarL/FixJ family response regulator